MPRLKTELDKRIIPFLGKIPDSTIAEIFGEKISRVIRTRHEKGIPACDRAGVKKRLTEYNRICEQAIRTAKKARGKCVS